MKLRFNKKLFIILYALIMAAFTLYAGLDSFVIVRRYTSEIPATLPSSVSQQTVQASSQPESQPAETAQPEQEMAEPVITDSSYEDGNISISISQFREYDTEIYVADIQLSSLEYLKTGFAEGTFGQNIKAPVSETAARYSAILAVNGDFYGYHGSGYVIRNGNLYRNTYKKGNTDLALMSDGSFFIFKEKEYSAETLLEQGAWQTWAFGPWLVQNGEVNSGFTDELQHPRTAFGRLDNLHYVFVVCDGRTDESVGLTLAQLADVMQSLGCTDAYNLDGGGSSSLVFNGKILNRPTSTGDSIKERSVSDIVYIGY